MIEFYDKPRKYLIYFFSKIKIHQNILKWMQFVDYEYIYLQNCSNLRQQFGQLVPPSMSHHSHPNQDKQPSSSCCCCLKYTYHMVRCPCMIIHAMSNHHCPVKQKTKKIHKLKRFQKEMSEKAAKNRLNNMFTLNLNVIQNQHEDVQCEVVVDNIWIPLVLQEKRSRQSQEQNDKMQMAQDEGQESHRSQNNHYSDKNNQSQKRSIKDSQDGVLIPESRQIEVALQLAVPTVINQAIANAIKKTGKPKTMVRGNLTSSSGSSKSESSHHCHNKAALQQISRVTKKIMEQKIDFKNNYQNEDLQVFPVLKEIDSLQQAMANECENILNLEFISESEHKKLASQINEEDSKKNQQQNQNNQSNHGMGQDERNNSKLVKEVQNKQLLAKEEGQVDEFQQKEVQGQNVQDSIQCQQQQLQKSKRSKQILYQLKQFQNQLSSPNNCSKHEQQQEGEIISDISSEDHSIQQKENKLQQLDQNEVNSQLQIASQPKKQETNQNPLPQPQIQNQSAFYSLSLIKKEGGSNRQQRNNHSREASYMTQRQHEINHHYSQPQNYRQVQFPQKQPQSLSQYQEYQYNHEQIQAEKSKKSRHSIRLNQELQSEQLRQQTEFDSMPINQEKLQHNSQGVASQRHSNYSEFPRSLPQLRKEHKNIKQQENQDSEQGKNFDFWQIQPYEQEQDDVKKTKQQSIEKGGQVKSQRYDGNQSSSDKGEGEYQNESIESGQMVSSANQDQQSSEKIANNPSDVNLSKPSIRADNYPLKQEYEDYFEQDQDQIQERELQIKGGQGRKKVKSEQSQQIQSSNYQKQSKSPQFSSQYNSNCNGITLQKMEESINYPLNQMINNDSQSSPCSRRQNAINSYSIFHNLSMDFINSQSRNANNIKKQESEYFQNDYNPFNLQNALKLQKRQAFNVKKEIIFDHFQMVKLLNHESKRQRYKLQNNLELKIERGGMNEQQLSLLPKIATSSFERIKISSQFNVSANQNILSQQKEQNKLNGIKKEQSNHYELEQEIIYKYPHKKRLKSHRRNYFQEQYPPIQKSNKYKKMIRQSRPRRKHYQDYYDYEDANIYEKNKDDSHSEEQRYVRQRRKTKKYDNRKKKGLRKVEEGYSSDENSSRFYRYE